VSSPDFPGDRRGRAAGRIARAPALRDDALAAELARVLEYNRARLVKDAIQYNSRPAAGEKPRDRPVPEIAAVAFEEIERAEKSAPSMRAVLRRTVFLDDEKRPNDYTVFHEGKIVGRSRPISPVPWYDAQPPRMSAPQDLCRAETRPLLDRKREYLLRCLFCKRSRKVVLDVGTKEKPPC